MLSKLTRGPIAQLIWDADDNLHRSDHHYNAINNQANMLALPQVTQVYYYSADLQYYAFMLLFGYSFL